MKTKKMKQEPFPRVTKRRVSPGVIEVTTDTGAYVQTDRHFYRSRIQEALSRTATEFQSLADLLMDAERIASLAFDLPPDVEADWYRHIEAAAKSDGKLKVGPLPHAAGWEPEQVAIANRIGHLVIDVYDGVRENNVETVGRNCLELGRILERLHVMRNIEPGLRKKRYLTEATQGPRALRPPWDFIHELFISRSRPGKPLTGGQLYLLHVNHCKRSGRRALTEATFKRGFSRHRKQWIQELRDSPDAKP